MGPFVHLLGVPRRQREATTPARLRGKQAWRLLAYLALHPGGVSRQRLAGLLFEDAEDPLAALRWNLSELRRALGDTTLRGDVIAFPHGDVEGVDVALLGQGRWQEALALPGLGQEPLEGHACASPAFDAWLQAERRRMSASCQAVLRDSTRHRRSWSAPPSNRAASGRRSCRGRHPCWRKSTCSRVG